MRNRLRSSIFAVCCWTTLLAWLWSRGGAGLGYAKMAVFLAIVIAAVVLLLHSPNLLGLLLIPALIFVLLAVVHERVLCSLCENESE